MDESHRYFNILIHPTLNSLRVKLYLIELHQLRKRMDNYHITASIKDEIALALGYNPKKPPLQVDERDAANVLGVKTSTLAVWRSTGRYNLPYMKVGRLIRYRVSDLADFLAKFTTTKTA